MLWVRWLAVRRAAWRAGMRVVTWADALIEMKADEKDGMWVGLWAG